MTNTNFRHQIQALVERQNADFREAVKCLHEKGGFPDEKLKPYSQKK